MQNENKKTYLTETDDLWKKQVEYIIPFLSGKGVDIGSGIRSLFENDVRVDIDKKCNPDVCCPADELPFKDGEFDFLYSIHSFEHVENQEKTIKEWARVVRSGGVIAIIHPDVNYTGVYRPDGLLPGENPYNEHKHENTYDGLLAWFKLQKNLPLKIVSSGGAIPQFSFYVILKKDISK